MSSQKSSSSKESSQLYRIQVAGLGFIHQRWQDSEPRFCSDMAKAKSWKTLEGALAFGNQRLTPRLAIGWELWQDTDGILTPLIRPQRSRSS